VPLAIAGAALFAFAHNTRARSKQTEKSPDDLSDRQKLFADLWIKQSELFSKIVATLPLVESGILASWYALRNQPDLAQYVAILGAIVMGVAGIILWRTTAYIRHFRREIAFMLPTEKVINVRLLGILLTILCVGVNAVLAFGWLDRSLEALELPPSVFDFPDEP